MKKLTTLAMTAFTALALTGCPSVPTQPTTPPTAQKQVRIGLALGGGAAKGFAHIGVIKVLENAGYKPVIVTGTSAGSVVGSLYASGLDAYQLQQKAILLDETNLVDFTLSFKGLIKGEKLQNFINKEVGNRRIEKLPLRFGAVATDFDTGKKVVFRSGNTGQAVRASSSIPNVFQPAPIGGRRYVDGGLVSPVPVIAARDMGADFVIAVDISAKPKAGSGSGFMSILDQSLNIMSVQSLESELKQADIVIRPQVQNIGTAGFSQRNQAIMEGEKAAVNALPLIKERLAKKQQSSNK